MRTSILASAVLTTLALITPTQAQGWLPRAHIGAWQPSASTVAFRIDGREYRMSASLTANTNTVFRFVPVNGRLVNMPVHLPSTTSVQVAIIGADGREVSANVVPIRASVRSAFRTLMRANLSPNQIPVFPSQSSASRTHFQGAGPAISSLGGFIVSVEVKTRSGTKVIDIPVSNMGSNLPGASIPI